ncbi:MAG: phage tail protein [Candidatus Thiodiazotropha sp. (ex Troendleina suluensis)]|nr:phage tail protein [Candidatus Thiodiazotropha sp. (ex Troendleina suluensis)]
MGQLLSLSLDEYHGILESIAGTEKQINTASRRAISKVVEWSATQIGRQIAVQEQVPPGILKSGGSRRGQRIFKSKPYGEKTSGSVWVGFNPIRAGYLGALSQQKVGAKAGRHFFLGGFVATMPSGHGSVFMRSGKTSLPIREQSHPLASAQNIVDRVQERSHQRLIDILEHELDYEVNIRGH